MPNHKRRIAKPKPLNPKGRKKKKSKAIETIDTCDCCGKPLGRLYGRMVGSAAIATGNGIAVSVDGSGKWWFFCNKTCAEIAV
jgi:hypothetical protein